MDKKPESALVKRMKKMKIAVSQEDSEKIEIERQQRAEMESQIIILDACQDMARAIEKQSGKHEQLFFSFCPTEQTRLSPFFILSKREQQRRITQEIRQETSWGAMTITSGWKLSIFDESVFLAALHIHQKTNQRSFEITRNAFCRIMGVSGGTAMYNSIFSSLKKLTLTGIETEIAVGKGRSRKVVKRMINTILSGARIDEKTNKLTISINDYFIGMYQNKLVTLLDLKLRNKIKSDIGKAIYRFLQSQKNFHNHGFYKIGLLKLSEAINLITFEKRPELFRVKEQIKKGLSELRKQGFLSNQRITKDNQIQVWKKNHVFKKIKS